MKSITALTPVSRRAIALHECSEGCRREGCVLVHKGLAKAQWCTSCGSMGNNCFAGCEGDHEDRLRMLADSAADREADAAFALPELDTSGPNDPHFSFSTEVT